jgi:phosphoribosyl-ATP pyrophosphohydrolase
MTASPAVPGAILERLFEVIEARREADPETSYVAKLLAEGSGAVARKVGEEAIELVVAHSVGMRPQTVAESADLMFHMMVLWADAGIRPAEVLAELEAREGLSGLEEKRRRGED